MGRHKGDDTYIYRAYDGCRLVCEGSYREIADKLFTCTGNIYHASRNGRLVGGRYRVTRQKKYGGLNE